MNIFFLLFNQGISMEIVAPIPRSINIKCMRVIAHQSTMGSAKLTSASI